MPTLAGPKPSRIALLLALLLTLLAWPSTSFATNYDDDDDDAPRTGAVYVLDNAVAGNGILMWNRDERGRLAFALRYPTGGLGTGAGLGSQDALILSENGKYLFAVDAGSNEISSFRVRRSGLELVGRVPSGGERPTSLTIHDDLLYVLNAGGAGNITGFSVARGALTPLPGSTRPLSSSNAGAAQVSFSPNGRTLVVAERFTNTISTYRVDDDTGLAIEQTPTTIASAGAVPFGFAFARSNILVISEAGTSSASSYRLRGGALNLVSGAVQNFQGAACWVVVARNGKFAYTANAGPGTISGYRVANDGSLTLLNADGVTGTAGAGATDMALSRNDSYLYVRNTRAGSISIFAVGRDGSLVKLSDVAGLPDGSAGLAAR